MASWKRHISVANVRNKKQKKGKGGSGAKSSNYASYLPSVYTGISNRVDRYEQYSQMDQDPEIGTGLDILADFCTQNDEDNTGPFQILYKDNNMGETEVTTIETALDSWTSKNDFKTRIWEIFRNTLKFGDQFFVRDPETFEWIWCDSANVEKVTVNESMGKEPIVYFMKDLSLNLQDKVISNTGAGRDRIAYPGAMPNALGGGNGGQFQSAGGYTGGGSGGGSSSPLPGDAEQNVLPVDANHVVHLSMSTGMDAFWPFGTSVLETIFKTYKQKELLEDSIIIYRVQRAPERRVFKIDVGDLPEHKAMQYVERIKNEIHQRRIPSNKGGSTSLLDSAYNPLSILEDFFFPQTADGRGSDVNVLPGGDNLGQIDDLRWFNNKLIRGLKIPSSYLPFGPEDGQHVSNDGGQGMLIQEHRFNKYCQRLQATIVQIFDDEFKKYLEHCGYNISPASFEVKFMQPTNFASYKKAELEGTMLQSYASLLDFPFIAKQTVLKKMGWTQDEIIENEKLWLQENPSKASEGGASAPTGDAAGLGAVGVENPQDFEDESGFDTDVPIAGEEGADVGGSPISGAENAGGTF